MAKKRKKRKTVKRKIVKKPSNVKAAHTLGLAGAVITLIAGILWAIASILQRSVNSISWIVIGDFGIVNIICGIVMIVAVSSFRKNIKNAAWFLLVFSILALIFPPAGFVVGPILSLVAGILLLMRK